MSEIFQNIVISVIGLIAIAFLIKKYMWPVKKNDTKSCGSDGCGC